MTKKNKILIITNGGIAVDRGVAWGNSDTGKLALALGKDYKITYCGKVISVKRSFLYPFNLTENRIRYFLIHGKKPKSYLSMIKLLFLILTHSTIYIYYPGGISKSAGKICHLLGKSYGVYVRGNGRYIFDNENIEKEKKFEFDNKKLLKHASFLITVSDKLKAELEILNSSNNVKVIKPMLDWDLKDVYQRNNIPFRERINMLFVGSIIELKGIYELVGMSRFFEQNNLRYSLKIIGDGTLSNDLINKQKNGEISQNIKITGSIKDKNLLSNEYDNADIFVFTSRNEGFPRVLYEAMLKSLPIFTTFVGGIPGLMKHNYNCIEIPVRDPEGQAKVIMEAIKKPGLLHKIARNGLETVTEVLTLRKPHHEVLIECIENGSKKK